MPPSITVPVQPLRSDSPLPWRDAGGHYAGGGYTVRLLGPGVWQVHYAGVHIGTEPTRTLALRHAEVHHRERVRAGQARFNGWLAVVAFVLLLSFFLAERGNLLLVIGLAVTLYVLTSSVMRWALAVARRHFQH